MKRVLLVTIVLVMVFLIGTACAENVVEYFANYYSEFIGSPMEYGVIGDRIFFVCDYDHAMAAESDKEVPEKAKDLLESFKEELKQYHYLVFVYTKDGMAYIIAEIPIEDGLLSETANGLVSQRFIISNMSLGQ